MTAQERWYSKPPLQLDLSSGELNLSPEEIQARAFRIDTRHYREHDIKLVAIESEPKYSHNRTDIVPSNWSDEIEKAMDDPSLQLVFVSYFSPELENTIFNSKMYGTYARSYFDQMLDKYQKIEDLAIKYNKRIAIADIANRLLFEVYEHFTPGRIPYKRQNSAYGINISRSEQWLPQAVDARRLFALEGLNQTLEGLPAGSSVMYVASPAHIRRMDDKLVNGVTRLDRARYVVYANTMFGLDTNTRIYEHSDDGWSLVSNEKYCKPGRQIMPVLLTTGAAMAGVALARRAKRP